MGGTATALSILFDNQDNFPPCVGYGFIRSICYGWMTDARMRVLHPRPCILGCGTGGDDFNHYAVCPIVWETARKLGLLRIPYVEVRCRMFLVLDGQEHIHLRLALLHACMISVHRLRGPHAHIARDEVPSYIRNNFRDILTRNLFLRNAFNSIWRQEG